ncbi:phospholipase D/nuclease [Gonapodya prolifera JEL478]|uniref:Mitochondrial cardiolipin hydrolase n=1 Tax=Gonapodya prolifera (strain JEL478) TaxID=1344416 RepID=A0A139ABB9_GONPJ|nr:phospholipase D/nuclease [Gonapodya prolifera JEL478]|eukprot:KXS14050.1 phospholipase D/nuclease [Gonapodya prolifera JEL478]
MGNCCSTEEYPVSAGAGGSQSSIPLTVSPPPPTTDWPKSAHASYAAAAASSPNGRASQKPTRKPRKSRDEDHDDAEYRPGHDEESEDDHEDGLLDPQSGRKRRGRKKKDDDDEPAAKPPRKASPSPARPARKPSPKPARPTADDDDDIRPGRKPSPSPKPSRPASVSPSRPTSGSYTATPYFFPSRDNLQPLLDLINNAKKSVFVSVFSLSNDAVSEALFLAHKRGLDVRIIADEFQSRIQGSDVVTLTQKGVPVKMDVLPAKKSSPPKSRPPRTTGMRSLGNSSFVEDDDDDEKPEESVRERGLPEEETYTFRNLPSGDRTRDMPRGWGGGGMMHNKFGIFDGKKLLTGSFNWTRNAQIVNNENFLIIDQPSIVKHYAREFEGLWKEGSAHEACTAQYEASEGVKAVFFPSEESFGELRRWLEATKKTLDVCIYNITDQDLSNTLVALQSRGVRVRVVGDDEEAKGATSKIQVLRQAGIPIKLDKPHSLMHNKFMIRDGSSAITGSYNWTRQARFFDRENVLFFNHPGAVKLYSERFETLWSTF